MSVPCQLMEYKYRREPSQNSVQWQRIGVAFSGIPEECEPGGQHQAGETNTCSIMFAVPYSDNYELRNATHAEYEDLADARFKQTHPGQELVV
jgi:hypothetical protein